MEAKLKVPLEIGWLSENSLLVKAAEILGYKVGLVSEAGVEIKEAEILLNWDDTLMFTTEQLVALGFERGDVEYCPCCKKPLDVCKQELADVLDDLDVEFEDSDESPAGPVG